MKIVLDARMYNSSGIGTYIKNILTTLIPKTHIVLLGNLTELQHLNCDKIEFNAPIYSISEQLKFPIIVPECDIFWSPHYNIPLLPIRAKKRVVTIHDVYHLAYYNKLSLKQKIYVKLLMQSAVKISNVIITVSNYSKSEIKRLTNCSDNIEMIYNGVSKTTNLKDFYAVKEFYKLPDNYILFTGNIKPHKNLITLLRAYLLLDAHLLNKFKLVIVGKKDGFITGDNEVFNFINCYQILKDNLIFTGYVNDDDLSVIYKQAAVFIFPSLYEGFGLPPLEAMAYECPVIVSNQSSMPEICGNAALYFDPINETDICEKIETVLYDSVLRKSLIELGSKRVAKFSWEESAESHLKLFKKVLVS